MSIIAAFVEGVLANFTLFHVLLFFDVFCAPGAQVVVNDRARPVVTMRLVMSRVEVTVAVTAMFTNDFGHLSIAIGA